MGMSLPLFIYIFLLCSLSKAPLKHTLLKTFRMTYARGFFRGLIFSLIYVRRNACFVKKSFWLGEAGPLVKEGHGSSRNQMSAQNSYTLAQLLLTLPFVKANFSNSEQSFLFRLNFFQIGAKLNDFSNICLQAV